MSNSDLEIRDAICEGAAAEQKRRGQLPTVVDNARYINGVLTAFDQKQAEREAKGLDRPTTTKKEGSFQREAERKGVDADRAGYQVDRKEVTARVGGPEMISVARQRLISRLMLLKSRPEWEDRIKTVNPLAMAGHLGPEKYKEAEVALRKIFAEADQKLGEWWRPPPAKPLIFS